LVIFGTILASPKGNAKEYVGCYTDALCCPVCSFDWSPFPFYLRFQFTWSVFPAWAFLFKEFYWKLLSTEHQHQLHVIFGVIFGCTNRFDLWAPEFPNWAYPITHYCWSCFTKNQQHDVGRILFESPYWRDMSLPGDAAEAAGLTCRTYNVDIDNVSDTK
jgi:hypothetical protein